MEPLMVLGQVTERGDATEGQLKAVLASAGVEVRPPFVFYRTHLDGTDYTAGQNWHHEATGVPGENRPGCNQSKARIVMWGYPESSEYRYCGSQEPISVAPGDVVLVDDGQVEHRRPAHLSSNRWFIRLWVSNVRN